MSRRLYTSTLAVMVLLGLVALPAAAAGPPPGSTLVTSGSVPPGGYYQIYCQPDGDIFVHGEALEISIGGAAPVTWPAYGAVTGSSPNNVTIWDLSSNEVYNDTVTCGGGGTSEPQEDSSPSPTPDPWPVDPAGVQRVLGGAGEAASGIVGFVYDGHPGVFHIYHHTGAFLGQIDLNRMMLPTPGGLLTTFDAPDGTQVRVYYMGTNEQGQHVLQINYYQPNGAYTEQSAALPGSEGITPTQPLADPAVSAAQAVQAEFQAIVNRVPEGVNLADAINALTTAMEAAGLIPGVSDTARANAVNAALDAYNAAILSGASHEQAQHAATAAALAAVGADDAVVQAAANGANMGAVATGTANALRDAVFNTPIVSGSEQTAAQAAVLNAYCEALNSGADPEQARHAATAAALEAMGADDAVVQAAASGADMAQGANDVATAYGDALLFNDGGAVSSETQAQAYAAAQEAYYTALNSGATREAASESAYQAAAAVLGN